MISTKEGAMKEMNTEEFKHVSLDLLIQLDRFCKENGIKYSLSYGTLLGAVRHHGFIPWDDDVDVMFLRSEYQKIITTFPTIYNQNYCLESIERNPNWNRPYAKFCDNRTLIFENAPYTPQGQGVGIDVFPIDSLPDNIFLRKIKNGIVIIHGFLFTIKSVRHGNFRSRIHNVFLEIFKFFLYPFSKRFLAKVSQSLAQLFNKFGGRYLSYCSEGKYINYLFPAYVFEKYDNYIFEENIFQAISDYDSFLKANYGDYMKLPPEEQMVTHHSFKAYWK